MNFFNIGKKKSIDNTITEILNNNICDSGFSVIMTKNLYERVIHKCFSRAILPDSVKESAFNMTIYDSYSPFKLGLASVVVAAMVKTKRVFLEKTTTDKGVIVFRLVETSEVSVEDAQKQPTKYLELDFREYKQVKLVEIMYCMIQGILNAVDKGVTVSQALVLKIHKLSEMIANASTQEALEDQLKQLNDGITQGKAGYIDGQSSIEFASYDSAPAEKSINLIYSIMANITGLPTSFLYGEMVGGLGSTESSDNSRLNDAIEVYYYNIVNNILYSLYGEVFGFKVLVNDINQLVSMFAFVETTELLTPAGKLKFMRNNTGFSDEDINIQVNAKTPAPKTTETINVNVDE